MKKMLLRATMLGMLLTAGSPAPADLAQEEEQGEQGGAAALAGNGPPPPDHVVTEGGTLVFQGDVMVPCRDVGPDDDPEGARLCEQYGFGPYSGDGEPVVTYAIPPGSDSPGPPCLEEDCIPPPPGAEGYGAEVLPDTGGSALLPLAGFAFVGGGLLLALRRPCTRRGLAES